MSFGGLVSLLVLTGLMVALFVVVCCLGYLDAVIALVNSLVVVFKCLCLLFCLFDCCFLVL